jgi:anti-sigma factor RsiW
MKARSVVELVCQEVVELITDYLGRDMSPQERVRVEQHLLTCPPCTAYLAQVTATVQLAKGLRDDDPGDATVDDDLLALFRRWNSRDSEP